MLEKFFFSIFCGSDFNRTLPNQNEKKKSFESELKTYQTIKCPFQNRIRKKHKKSQNCQAF